MSVNSLVEGFGLTHMFLPQYALIFNTLDRSYAYEQWRIQGGGGLTVCVCDRGDYTPPPTCPDPENLCKVCVTGTDHPPYLLGTCKGPNDQAGGVCQFFGGWMTSRGQCLRGGVLMNVFTPPPLQEILYPRLLGACLKWSE